MPFKDSGNGHTHYLDEHGKVVGAINNINVKEGATEIARLVNDIGIICDRENSFYALQALLFISCRILIQFQDGGISHEQIFEHLHETIIKMLSFHTKYKRNENNE